MLGSSSLHSKLTNYIPGTLMEVAKISFYNFTATAFKCKHNRIIFFKINKIWFDLFGGCVFSLSKIRKIGPTFINHVAA